MSMTCFDTLIIICFRPCCTVSVTLLWISLITFTALCLYCQQHSSLGLSRNSPGFVQHCQLGSSPDTSCNSLGFVLQYQRSSSPGPSCNSPNFVLHYQCDSSPGPSYNYRDFELHCLHDFSQRLFDNQPFLSAIFSLFSS